MMEEKQLKKLFLFRRLGAFSVIREKPREASKSIVYASTLLKKNPQNTLWIFPQGVIMPNDSRPLKFYNGLSKIIGRVKKCAAASLSMRYEFLGEFKPRVFVKIEEPEIISVDEDFDPKRLTEMLSARLTQNLDGLKNDVVEQNLARYKSVF